MEIQTTTTREEATTKVDPTPAEVTTGEATEATTKSIKMKADINSNNNITTKRMTDNTREVARNKRMKNPTILRKRRKKRMLSNSMKSKRGSFSISNTTANRTFLS